MANVLGKRLIAIIPPVFTITIVGSLLLGALAAIIFYSKDLPFSFIINESYIQYVIGFTIWQASLSTILTIVIAIPIARALHRRRDFWLRKLIIKITSLSFILPSIVLVLGIALVHGKKGWINKFLSLYDLSLDYYLYGIFGILAGHLAFCLPLSIRVFLNKLDSIPNETWRLSSQLGFSSTNIFKIIEYPVLKPSIAGVGLIIFMMCFTSFTIVLCLGGGPDYSTIELAIYQALRFNFDIGRAVTLSLVQFLICFILMIFAARMINHSLFIYTKSNSFFRPDINCTFNKLIDTFFIFVLFIIIIMPILAILSSGITIRIFNVLYDAKFWSSFAYSVLIAFSSGILSVCFAAGILIGCFYIKYHLDNNELSAKFSMIANSCMIMPPFILTTGLFILLKDYVDIFEVAIYLVIIVNAIMALPFVVAILYQSVTSFTIREIRVCRSLGLDGWNFFKLICWRRIKRAVGNSLALAVALSWGDLTIITLFGSKDFLTLPYLLYINMSNYKFDDAGVIAFIILLISYILFWIIEEFIGGEKVGNTG